MGYILDLRKELTNPSRPLIMTSAGTIIINDEGKVLLQQRTDNLKWGFPGGSLELGESFEEAAIREAKEEVGLTLNTLKLFNVYSGEKCYNKYPNGHEIYNASAIFICSDYEGEFVLDLEETKNAVFFSKDEFPKMSDINPPDRAVVEDIIKSLNLHDYEKNIWWDTNKLLEVNSITNILKDIDNKIYFSIWCIILILKII